ncbi:hypothetical protein [uncultured Roseobacter sp.]|nr:hypothetical protein [uncultured Roseobacter sp.]
MDVLAQIKSAATRAQPTLLQDIAGAAALVLMLLIALNVSAIV